MKRLSYILLAAAAFVASEGRLPAQQAGISVDRQLDLKRRLLAGSDENLQAAIRRNKQDWEQLSPELRKTYRDRYYAFLKTNPDQRQDIIDNWIRFSRLSHDEKEKLRRRAEWVQQVLSLLSNEQKDQLRKMTPQSRAVELLRLKRQFQHEGRIPADPEPVQAPAVPSTQPATPAE